MGDTFVDSTMMHHVKMQTTHGSGLNARVPALTGADTVIRIGYIMFRHCAASKLKVGCCRVI